MRYATIAPPMPTPLQDYEKAAKRALVMIWAGLLVGLLIWGWYAS